MDTLLTIDALSITPSKRLSFPLTLQVAQSDFQAALAASWQIIDTLRQSLLGYDGMGHGKLLLLSDFNEDVSAEPGRFIFRVLEDGQVQLELTVCAALIFDFQSTLWQRLASVATALDYLQQLCIKNTAAPYCHITLEELTQTT
jgi:hypothetical protein